MTATVPRQKDAPEQSGREPVLDLEVLKAYTADDWPLALEVLGLFAGHAPSYCVAMKAAESQDAWSRNAHALKGSARAVGALRLAALCQEAEHLDPFTPERAAPLLAEIEAALGAVKDKAARLAQPEGESPLDRHRDSFRPVAGGWDG